MLGTTRVWQPMRLGLPLSLCHLLLQVSQDITTDVRLRMLLLELSNKATPFSAVVVDSSSGAFVLNQSADDIQCGLSTSSE